MRATRNGQGGGGAGPVSTISGNGGVVETINDPFNTGGVTISPAPGRALRLNGPVTDAANQPQAPDALHLVGTPSPAAPPTGKLFYLDAFGYLHARGGDGQASLAHSNGARIVAGPGSAELSNANGQGALFIRNDGSFELDCLGSDIEGDVLGNLAVFVVIGANLSIHGLPLADPHVANALWIAPLTRQLMVSAG